MYVADRIFMYFNVYTKCARCLKQSARMRPTMERLAEVIFKGVVQKGSMQKCTRKSTQSKPKPALFFKSSSMPLRFLSTLVVLRTTKQGKFWFLLCLF